MALDDFDHITMFRGKRLRDGKMVYGYLVQEISTFCSGPDMPGAMPVILWHIMHLGSANGEPVNTDDIVDPATVEIYFGHESERGACIYMPLDKLVKSIRANQKE